MLRTERTGELTFERRHHGPGRELSGAHDGRYGLDFFFTDDR
jgi:hypothetical protein